MNFTSEDGERWQSGLLGELCSLRSGNVHPKATPEAFFNYVGLENISPRTGKLTDFKPTVGYSILSAKIAFKAGDLLYGRLRPYLQKVLVAPFDGVASTDILVFKPTDELDLHFLKEFFLSAVHLEQLNDLMSGARMPRVTASALMRLPIRCPSRNQQKAVAESLASVRTRFEQTENKLSSVERHLGELTRKGFDLAASRVGASSNYEVNVYTPGSIEPTLPDGWHWISLEELVSPNEPICYGVVETGDEVSEGVPLIRGQDLEDGMISSTKIRNVSNEVDEKYRRSRVSAGDVLVTIVGTVIGKVATVSEEYEGANINRAVARVRLKDLSNAAWVKAALNSAYLQDWMHHQAQGSGRNILNIGILQKAPIPFPPQAIRHQMLTILTSIGNFDQKIRGKISDVRLLKSGLKAEVERGVFNGNVRFDKHIVGAIDQEWETEPSVEASVMVQHTDDKPMDKSQSTYRGKRSLIEVLKDYPEGLDPLSLLRFSGYELSDVERFYLELSKAVRAGVIVETRPSTEAVLLRGQHAH